MALKAGYKGIKEVGPGLDYDNTTGLLTLDGESSLKLDNLEDVSIDTPLGGDVLQYDSSNEEWTNETPDTEPIEDSPQLITSGAVYAGLKTEDDKISAIWSSNARTGVHQWFNKSLAVGNNATVVQTATGLEVTGTAVGYTSAKIVMDYLPKNTDFELSLTATTENGNKTVYIQGSADKSSWTTLVSKENVTNFKETFNTGSYNYIQVVLYAGSNSTPADSKVTYSDILLKLSSDTSNEVTPYAMTNGELTPTESACTDAVGTTDPNYLLKQCKLVALNISIDNVTVSAGDILCKIPTGYRPKFNTRAVAFDTTNNTFIMIQIKTNGNINTVSALTGVKVLINTVWVTD